MVTLIGIEEHWNDQPIDSALRSLTPPRSDPSLALNDRGDTAAKLTDVGTGRLADMDAQGVGMQILALAPPATQPLDAIDAVPLARAANDRAVSIVAEHPDRFAALATLPMADPPAAAEELERCASLGLRGTMLYGRTVERQLDDAAFEDLYAVAESRAMPLFIHPQIPPADVRAAAYSGLSPVTDLALATYGWGWHLEAGTAALRMMAAGILDRHPRLQLILGHWGELLLFWHDRADSIARTGHLQRTVTEYLRENIWITASGMLDPAMMRHALEITTPDRILFSTDYPFQRPTKGEIDRFLSTFPDDESREAFAHGNAETLFDLLRP
ncbi:amidohydrolase family protein [Kocuria rhizophila]|uniref:amidohydrolase family protein n=1 Tax=Kocuria rhizophila TaxID=72000 RepID=UPI0034DB1B32